MKAMVNTKHKCNILAVLLEGYIKISEDLIMPYLLLRHDVEQTLQRQIFL
ncbi:hypothetical protein DSUL_150006 [Desulfovibrionales bacterium]